MSTLPHFFLGGGLPKLLLSWHTEAGKMSELDFWWLWCWGKFYHRSRSMWSVIMHIGVSWMKGLWISEVWTWEFFAVVGMAWSTTTKILLKSVCHSNITDGYKSSDRIINIAIIILAIWRISFDWSTLWLYEVSSQSDQNISRKTWGKSHSTDLY